MWVCEWVCVCCQVLHCYITSYLEQWLKTITIISSFSHSSGNWLSLAGWVSLGMSSWLQSACEWGWNHLKRCFTHTSGTWIGKIQMAGSSGWKRASSLGISISIWSLHGVAPECGLQCSWMSYMAAQRSKSTSSRRERQTERQRNSSKMGAVLLHNHIYPLLAPSIG